MSKTLVLSSAMQPIRVCSWEDAMTLVSKGSAEVLEEYEEVVGTLPVELAPSYRDFLHSIRRTIADAVDGVIDIHMPSVIRVRRHFSKPVKKAKFSRVNVFTRDQWSCMYCGAKYVPQQAFKKLTYDHVVPRHQGGRTVWTNVATACRECNAFKANRTPQQAKMKLRGKLRTPDTLPLTFGLHIRGEIPEQWKPYLEPFSATPP